MLATSRALTGTITFLASTILIATLASASPGADISGAGCSCLVLEWMDPHDLLETRERWVASETLRVLEGANVGARWEGRTRRTSARRGEHRLRVVLVPSEPSGPGWRLSPTTLGATVVDKDNAPPAVYIFYNAVTASLGSRTRADHRYLGGAARALGRVIAHEIAHAIVPSKPHAADGLMRASLDRRFLMAKRDVTIDANWKHALGRGLSELCSNR